MTVWCAQGQHGLVNITQDSFYRDLTSEEAANVKDYNFDHPDAFAFDEIVSTLRNLRAGRRVEVPVVRPCSWGKIIAESLKATSVPHHPSGLY
jgi:uridine kinase